MKLAKHMMKSQWLVEAEYLKPFMDINTDDFDANAISSNSAVDAITKKVHKSAVIQVSGVLSRYDNCVSMLFEQTTYQGLRSKIQYAVEDPSVDDIYLDFDTPGGMVNGIYELAAYINEAKKKKPVYAHVSNMAASAGYWLASQCTSIHMAKTATVGSIGVVATIYKPSEEEDTYEIVSSGAPNKRLEVGSDDFNNAVQEKMDKLEAIFVEAVANGRGVSVDIVRSDFGGGSTFLAEDAVSIGMADSIGTLEELISQKSKGEKMTDLNQKSDAPVAMDSQNLEAAVAKARLYEKERVLAILGSEHAVGRQALALKLAGTYLDATQAVDILSSAPAEAAKQEKAEKKESILDKVMASNENAPVVASNITDSPLKDVSGQGLDFQATLKSAEARLKGG